MEYERIILRMQEEMESLRARVRELEETVYREKTDTRGSQKGQRDRTRYEFKGREYVKNRLVLAVVTDYVRAHPSATVAELERVFPRGVQGALGILRSLPKGQARYLLSAYYFVLEGETVAAADGEICVCSQWNNLNFPAFLCLARELGYGIAECVGLRDAELKKGPTPRREVTQEMIDLCYTCAVSAHRGEITMQEAESRVTESTDMNRSTAWITVFAVSAMLKGEAYKRAISRRGTETFLANIARDYGTEGVRGAVRAVRGHNDYYEHQFGRKLGYLEDLCNDYEREYLSRDNGGQDESASVDRIR